jgi:tRNA(Ile)-lysidine synthase
LEVKIPGRTVSPEWELDITTEVLDAIPDAPPSGQGEVLLDADPIGSSLSFRQRRDGDRFRPLGMEGSKKLQDFFVDLKVPREERDRVPIFVSKGVIASVGTLRTDERFGVKDSSSRILRLSVFPFLSEG